MSYPTLCHPAPTGEHSHVLFLAREEVWLDGAERGHGDAPRVGADATAREPPSLRPAPDPSRRGRNSHSSRPCRRKADPAKPSSLLFFSFRFGTGHSRAAAAPQPGRDARSALVPARRRGGTQTLLFCFPNRRRAQRSRLNLKMQTMLPLLNLSG